MNKTSFALGAIIIIAVIIFFATRSTTEELAPVSTDTTTTESMDHSETETADTMPPASSDTGISTDVQVSVGAGTVKSFTVDGNNFAFSPKTITVNKGDTVRITFKNTGGTHDLKIDEFNVSTAKLSGGQEETIEFVADKAGTFEYYCSIGSHREMGMWGTLTVK